ncbi:MAG: pantoate--beta-alanine ligase [Acidimicrobiales bacterium]
MEVITSAEAFSSAMGAARSRGERVGLVPTMGALHPGHDSLVAAALDECDLCAVSIFVNPLQFTDHEDLALYPRTEDEDLLRCARLGVGIVFVPGVIDMYPGWPQVPGPVAVPQLARAWEGESRPGHFQGVVAAVSRLFALGGACRAYFGEKDYQQLQTVTWLAAERFSQVDVVGCPTIREPDGLALSSRNLALCPRARRAATIVHRALVSARQLAQGGERRPDRLCESMATTIHSEPLAELDYGAVVRADDLVVPERLDGGRYRLLIAAALAGVRLIDNLALELTGREQMPRGAS